VLQFTYFYPLQPTDRHYSISKRRKTITQRRSILPNNKGLLKTHFSENLKIRNKKISFNIFESKFVFVVITKYNK
jgi:hypothetical protein